MSEEEWKAEMMKFTKEELINMLRVKDNLIKDIPLTFFMQQSNFIFFKLEGMESNGQERFTLVMLKTLWERL